MKRLLFLLFSICASLCAFPQGFRYGITAGPLISTPENYRSHLGFQAGIKGDYSFTNKANDWAIGASLLLTSKGWKDKVAYVTDDNSYTGKSSLDWTCTFRSLELPILAKYTYHFNAFAAIYAEAGPYIACGLWGKSKIETLPDFDIHNIYKEDMYRRFDFGAKTCVGIELSQWQIGVGWSRSFRRPTKKGLLYNPKDISFSLQISFFF